MGENESPKEDNSKRLGKRNIECQLVEEELSQGQAKVLEEASSESQRSIS